MKVVAIIIKLACITGMLPFVIGEWVISKFKKNTPERSEG